MRPLPSDFWLNITRAMLSTLDLERFLYILLSGSTAGDGLQFNRAFLFLAHEEERKLEGTLAIGPSSQEEAFRIWEAMVSQRFDLPLLLARFATFHEDAQASALTSVIKGMSFPLPLTGHSPFEHLIHRAIRQHSVVSNDTAIPLMETDIVLYHVGVVSLVVAEQLVGVLVVDNAFNRRRISTQELNLLATIGNLVALGIERARLYERIRVLTR